jgi:hypothetical protein
LRNLALSIKNKWFALLEDKIHIFAPPCNILYRRAKSPEKIEEQEEKYSLIEGNNR